MRPRKDKFEETSIGFEKGTEHELVYVSNPSFSKITYKVNVSKDLNGKAIYGTSDQTIRTLYYTDNEVKKLFGEKDMIVTKIEKATIPLPNICEKCHRIGTPIIERKSNKFYYHYTPKNDSSKNKSNRPDEYWLIYDHKTSPNKCRIAQFDKNHFRFKLPKNRTSKLHKHFFPFYLEWLKKELTNRGFFQKFFNTIHL